MAIQGMVEASIGMKGSYAGNHWERFLEAESADSLDRRRGLENLQLYLPTHALDVFDPQVQREFVDQNRKPNKYNFIPMYAEAHAGNLVIANSVDPKFIDSAAIGNDSSDTLNTLLDVYYTDKNAFNYDKARNSAVLNGCIYRGVEEVHITRKTDDGMPRIYFESLAPTSVIFDPTAIFSDDIAEEARESWRRFYYYPKELMSLFPDAKNMIRGYAQSQSNFSQARTYIDVPEEVYWQNKLQVIEWHHTIAEKVEVAYDTKYQIELPNEKGLQFGSKEDFMFKQDFMKEQGRSLDPGDISTSSKMVDTLYLTTFCPTLNLTLQSKRDERQIFKTNGDVRLPYHVWAFYQKNGKTSGLIDTIKDAQNDINLREAAKTKWLTQTMHNKTIIHPLAYGDDMAKRNNMVNNLNDPSEPLLLDEDAPIGVALIQTINGGPMNPAFMEDEHTKIEFMNKMTGLNPAMQGIEGKSGESGILYGRKVSEGNMLAKHRSDALQNYEKSKQDSWFQLALLVYSGQNKDERIVNRNRSFVNKDGKRIILNEVTGYDPDNTPIVINDLSKIKRGYTIISVTKQNDFRRQQEREVNIALSNAMGPTTPQNAGLKAILEADLVMGVEDLSPERKAQIEEMSEINVEIAKKTLILTELQLDQQIAQLQGGQPQMPGIPGDGGGGQQQALGGPQIPPELANMATQGQLAV